MPFDIDNHIRLKTRRLSSSNDIKDIMVDSYKGLTRALNVSNATILACIELGL
jgi:hypothetical protein